MAVFDVITISCSSKIRAKIEANIGSLEREYVGNKLAIEKRLTIDSGNGSKYNFKIGIRDLGVGRSKVFQLFIDDVEKLECEMKMILNGTISKNLKFYLFETSIIISLDGELTGEKGKRFKLSAGELTEKIKSVKADITLEFEPKAEVIFKEKFKNYVNSFFIFKPDGNGEDFQIVCQGKKFGFDKSILCKISPVFERMLMNPGFPEYKNGCTEIKNTNPKTIEAFKNILSLDRIEKEELSVELLLFADQYQIEPLYKFCQEYLCTAISEENLFDVIKAANFIDQELMSKAAEFFMKSDSFDIEDNPKWDEFCKENPECGNKILKLVVGMLKKK